MLLLLASSAFAADGPGPFFAPSATPMERHLDASAGAAFLEATLPVYCEPTIVHSSEDDPDHLHDDTSSVSSNCGSPVQAAGGAFLEVRGQPVRALGLHAAALTALDGSGEVVQADLRFTVVDRTHVHLAPYVGAIAMPGGTFAATGLSFDAGGEVATFDVSMPLLAATFDAGPEFVSLPSTLLMTEAGVTFHLSPTQALRVGLESLAPGMAWRGEFGPVFVQARLHGLVLVNGGSLEVGMHI